MTEKSSVSDLKRQITLTGKSVNNLKRPSYLDRKKKSPSFTKNSFKISIFTEIY